jgi:8-oxo-dGTP diphosphatase
MVRDLYAVRVGAYLITDDEILLFQNPKGTWGIAGGHVDYGEQPLEALSREIEEEAGIKVLAEDFNYIKNFIDKKDLIILHWAKINKQDVKISHEHLDYAWVKFEDVEKYNLTYENAFKEDLKSILNSNKNL